MGSSPNVIQVGAVVDLGQYKAGMQDAVATTEATTRQMSVAFERHAATSHEAVGGIKLAFEDAGIALNRHVARWLAAVPVLGAAAGAIFPVVAIFSFIESLSKADEKVDSHVEKMAKAARESLDLALSFDKQAESIRIANLKLEDHIATLQRKPTQNGVVIAALEAKRALDELIKSFADAIAKEKELLATEKQGFLDRLLHGDSGVNDVISQIEQFNEKILDATTKFRLVARDGSKQQTAEAKAELDKQVADYRAFLNTQIAADDVARQKKIQQVKDDTEAINKENGLKLTSAQFEDQISRNVAAVTREYEKRDQTLRSLLILIKDENAAESGISKHADLVGADVSAEKLRKLQDVLDKAGQDIRKMAEAADKDQVAAADRTTKEILALSEKQNNEIIKSADKQLAAWDELYKGQIDAAKQTSEIKIQQITQDFERGKISQQQEISLIAKAKQDELALEVLFHQKRQALWSGDLRKVQEVENAIAKATRQSELEAAKATTESIKVREQQYRQLFSQIGSALSSNVKEILAGTETISQGFQKMYQSLIGGLIDYVAKKAEKKAEEWLIEEIFGKKKAAANVAQATSSVGVAAAEALASVPWPFNIAAAAETEGAGAAFESQAAVAFFAQGTNFVPQDGLAYLHKGEEIIPASKQGSPYSGSGGDIHVHYSVSAVDASSFQAHIKRHSNMIANEVTRALKRKGIK